MILPVRNAFLWVSCWAWAGLAGAQTLPEPHNVVHISASAQKEAQQDWLTMVLVARHQAAEPAAVQNQLKLTLDKALAQARAKAADNGLQVSSGAFTVQPRYGKEGQIAGWQGSAELLLQGRDVARVTALAAQLQDMVVAQLGFSLSPEAVKVLESEVRQSAIANFKTSAQETAQGFGFHSWVLREVSVQTGADAPIQVRSQMLRAPALAASNAGPVPVEPGRSVVQVNVSGTVQLR